MSPGTALLRSRCLPQQDTAAGFFLLPSSTSPNLTTFWCEQGSSRTVSQAATGIQQTEAHQHRAASRGEVFKVINWLCLEYIETETVSLIVFLGESFFLEGCQRQLSACVIWQVCPKYPLGSPGKARGLLPLGKGCLLGLGSPRKMAGEEEQRMRSREQPQISC